MINSLFTDKGINSENQMLFSEIYITDFNYKIYFNQKNKIMKNIMIIVLVILSVSCQAQTKNKEVMKKNNTKAQMAYKEAKSDFPVKITYQSLSQMDRDTLISLAKAKVNKHLKLLKEEPFDYIGVETKVLKNSKTFIVYFEQSFKYVPLHTAHYYGFYVNLLEDDISRLNRTNEATNGEFSYYSPSVQDLKKIAFVKKAINYKSGYNVVVREKENHYELAYETSGEKVDKKTGKVFDFWDRICAPPTDPLIEMLANPCPTQKDLEKGFENLKKVILKKGKKRRYDGDDYPTTSYTFNDMVFSYRSIAPNSKYPQEIIHVTGSGSYWIIKSEGTYAINNKAFPAKIAKQKRKAALDHFCNHLLNFKE